MGGVLGLRVRGPVEKTEEGKRDTGEKKNDQAQKG